MPTLSSNKKLDLNTRFQVAQRAARRAGDVIMAHYGRQQVVQTKSSELDLVTQVDLESDALIREILCDACPDDHVITEETYQEGQPIDLTQTWIVDPLDGTTNYAHGFPQFAVSIAYVENGEPKLGVIYDPFKNELFAATEKGEVMKNGLPIHVSTVETLSRSLLATGFPYNIQSVSPEESNITLHDRFLKLTHGIRRPGAAALDLAYVACGRLDGFWELHLAPWDVAAGMLLLQCAGGRVSGFCGETLDLSQRQISIVGSNGHIHNAMVQVTAAS